jgi:MFS family permease
MNKQQIVSLIENQLAAGSISKEDLLAIANTNTQITTNQSPADNQNITGNSDKHESSKNLINVFYGIGAIIALVGVVILVEQNWNEIGFLGRVLVTMGISVVTYIAAFLLNKPPQKVISQVMFTISGALAPLGIYVLLNEANISFGWPFQFYAACALSIIFGFSLWATRKNILVLLTVGFASWAYYSFVLKIFGNSNYDLLKWASMLLGFSYIMISYGYQSYQAEDPSEEKEKTAIKNVLYGFGTLFILAAGISVGGLFDLIFIAIIFGAFYGSVFLKSRAMLTFASLFLMAHIAKLTSDYFVDSIGWPVALIIIGFLVIGVGYMAFALNKRYMSVSA